MPMRKDHNLSTLRKSNMQMASMRISRIQQQW